MNITTYIQSIAKKLAQAKSRLDASHTGEQGIIRMLVIVIAGVLFLSWLGFDLRALWEDPTTQKNFSFVKEIVIAIWSILGPILAALWDFAWPIIQWIFETIREHNANQ